MLEEDGYALPHGTPRLSGPIPSLPPPPGKGRIVIGPNTPPPQSSNNGSSILDAGTRRRLPNRPQMPIFPQGQRALPGTNHIYGNIQGHYISANQMPAPQPPSSARLATPNSAFLTNLANKRIMNNAINKR